MREINSSKEIKDSPKIFDSIKSESNTTLNEAKESIKNRIENNCNNYIEFRTQKFYSEEKDRIEKTPREDSIYGKFTGERGNSTFIPTSEKTIAKLAEYNMKGIEYKNGEPNFSKCSEISVQIKDMSEIREQNFKQADKILISKWNSEQKDGRTNWTLNEAYQYRKENNLSWHERCDCKTMDLVSRDIHENKISGLSHSGGCHECRIRDGNKGGQFDE